MPEVAAVEGAARGYDDLLGSALRFVRGSWHYFRVGATIIGLVDQTTLFTGKR